MQTLLTVIVSWLAINFGLPASYDHPKVEIASPARMAEVRHSRLTAAERAGLETLAGGDVFAMYDDATRTVFLHEDWSGATPADSSLLVHEMVHHLQKVAGTTFACGGEREKLAYRAQRAWLELFGRSLETDFGLDPMTIMLRTNCLN